MNRIVLLLLCIIGFAAAKFAPLSVLPAQSGVEAGYSQVMHYSTNRLFVWAAFLPGNLQQIFVTVLAVLAGILVYRGSAIQRALAGVVAAAVVAGISQGDIVVMCSAVGALIFCAARSSLVLNGLGLLAAPQLAILSRCITAVTSKPPAAGILILVLGVSLGISLCAPDLNFPAYPPLGHVVPTYGVLFHEAARIGYAAPLDFGNLIVEQSAIAFPALFLIIAGFLVPGLAIRKGVFVVGVVGAVDSLLPPSLSYLSPARALFRLLPTLSELPLSSIYIGVASSLMIFAALSERSMRLYLILCAWLCAQFALPDPLAVGTIRDNFFSLARSPRLEEYVQRNKAGAARVINSPSLYPVFLRGARFARHDFKGCTSKPHSIGTMNHQVVASANQPAISFLYDGKRDTRWSAETGRQIGNEWLSVRLLDGPTKLAGMQLMTGEFLTDYARGLAIYYAKSCVVPLTPESPKEEVFNEAEWQGELAITRDGFPYFKEERYTRLLFGAEIDAQCLLIKQIGKSSSYDWSVTDLRLIESSSAIEGECESDQH